MSEIPADLATLLREWRGDFGGYAYYSDPWYTVAELPEATS